jgi:hypothetical protein
MTDIVERLRQGTGHWPDDIMDAEKVMDEAADEIERLRALIAELTADCPICHGLGCPPIGCGRALMPPH